MRLLIVACLVVVSIVVASPACTCQRQDNVEAKARMKEAVAPRPAQLAAQEAVATDNVKAGPGLDRICRMSGEEIQARLGSFQFQASADMSFGRGDDPALRASERTSMTQASRGDFSIETLSGDASEMRLLFVNGIFFLKNNNGRWRVSRDPGGEREEHRSEALGVWRAFYDLVAHALVAERTGATTVDGRNAIGYRLSLRDDSSKAAANPPLPEETVAPGPDGGVSDEGTKKRISARVRKWRQRAHPKSGSGTLVVDEKTGVALSVQFSGEMVVGDGPTPTVLMVKIDQRYSGIGAAYPIEPPPEAIEAITRTKWPARPREPFEEAGIVTPLPRDAGPAPTRKRQQAGVPDGADEEDDR